MSSKRKACKQWSARDKKLKALVAAKEPFHLHKITVDKLKQLKKKDCTIVYVDTGKNGEYEYEGDILSIKKTTVVLTRDLFVLIFVYYDDDGAYYTPIAGEDMKHLKKATNNLITASHSHSSTGESYGYGVGKKYTIDNNGNSYGLRGRKKNVSEVEAKERAKFVIQGVEMGVKVVKTFLGETFYKNAFQKIKTGFEKNTVFKAKDGLVNFILNIDVATTFHTDTDACYSVLVSSKCGGEAKFHFKNICKIDFSNKGNCVIFYAAKVVEHHQQIVKQGFINAGSYVQEKLINHLQRSVERKTDTRSIAKIKKMKKH